MIFGFGWYGDRYMYMELVDFGWVIYLKWFTYIFSGGVLGVLPYGLEERGL